MVLYKTQTNYNYKKRIVSLTQANTKEFAFEVDIKGVSHSISTIWTTLQCSAE